MAEVAKAPLYFHKLKDYVIQVGAATPYPVEGNSNLKTEQLF